MIKLELLLLLTYLVVSFSMFYMPFIYYEAVFAPQKYLLLVIFLLILFMVLIVFLARNLFSSLNRYIGCRCAYSILIIIFQRQIYEGIRSGQCSMPHSNCVHKYFYSGRTQKQKYLPYHLILNSTPNGER